MIAKNLMELKEMLTRELDKAMKDASDQILADMYEETAGFYQKGSPEMYERTGALGDTPRVTANKFATPSKFDVEIKFNAYLDQRHKYTTGDKPQMDKVLELANYGKSRAWITKNGKLARPTLGRKGFWERAEKKMEKSLKRSMRRRFKLKYGSG